MPCPDRCPCRALVTLGYLVVHCAAGELFEIVAFPNSHTLTLKGDRWIAATTLTGIDREDARAIAFDRGGAIV